MMVNRDVTGRSFRSPVQNAAAIKDQIIQAIVVDVSHRAHKPLVPDDARILTADTARRRGKIRRTTIDDDATNSTFGNKITQAIAIKVAAEDLVNCADIELESTT